MFPRSKPLWGALLTILLLAAGGPAFAQYNPQATGSTLNTLSFTWSAGAGSPYTVAVSTSPTFYPAVGGGSLSTLTSTYINLGQNTTYYFRIKRSAESDSVYASNTASSSTLVAAPSGLFSVPSDFSAISSFTATASIGWNVNGNPEWTRYEVQHADNIGFASPSLALINMPPVTIGGLKANTTYYFRVRARGVGGSAGAYIAAISTPTLAVRLSGLAETVRTSSVTLAWTPLNDPAIQALNSEGYRLHLSTSYIDVALTPPATTYWETASSDTASVLAQPLDPNTTYYYRIGALNWSGQANIKDDQTRSFTTLAPPLAGLAVNSVANHSAALSWTALIPGDALGYRLEAATYAVSGQQVTPSSVTYLMSDNSLAVAGLDANTTYYFRAASLNLAYTPHYTSLVSSITLANPPSANLTTIVPDMYDLTAFIYPLPAYPQSAACEGYVLDASSTAFDGTGVVYSSATADPQAASLQVAGLKPNTLYSLRLATLNWAGNRNYSALDDTFTSLPPAPVGPILQQVWQSSAAITFTAGAGGDTYLVEASTYQYFDYIHRSSATTDQAVTSLTIDGLHGNTRYYFRAGGIYGGTPVYTNTAPAYRNTLPARVLLDSPAVPAVYYSSATLAWTPLPASPPEDTAEAYVVEAATSPEFTTVLFSSATSLVAAVPALTVQGLSPNTTYYLRTGSVNFEGRANYSVAPATATLANRPTQQASPVTPYTVTLTWLANSNPPDTRYLVVISSNSDFTPPVHSSSTYLSSATFSGLVPNTTYYPLVTAYNRFGRATPTVVFSSGATAAFHPAYDDFSDVGVSSMTVNWLPGTNPAETWYRAQISSNTDFSGTVLSSVTANLYAIFDGMVSNASYYLQVSALNLTGVPTDPPVSLGTALTLPATAYILSESQTYSSRLTDGFTVNWASNGNSSHTVYGVEVSTKADFSVMNSSLSVRALACSFKDLLVDTTYFTRIKARGQTGIFSAFETAWSTKTLLSTQLNAVALQESTINLETSYGTVSVFIPRGAIGSSTRFQLQPAYIFPPPVSSVSELTPTGVGISVTHFPPTLVLGAITLTLPYRLSDLPPGTDRSRLILALYDEGHGVWVPLPSVSETVNNRVIGQTWHLSTFQLMEAVSETGLSNVKIYPNPYRPNSVSDVMHFTNLTPFAKVKLYTFLGELVRDLKADVNGMAYWDGLNSDGRKVASGVYIAFISTSDKKSSKSFKVAVER